MAIRGKVIFVGQPENGTSKAGKPWSKQMFAIETEGQYPKKVAFGVMNGKITMNMGDIVEVEVDAQSREYQGKWYTELTAWRCNNLGNQQYAQSQQTYAQPAPQQQPVFQQQPPQGYAAPQYPQNPAPQAPANDLPF